RKLHVEMESHGRARPWGKLVKVDSNGSEVLLVNRECTVGRRKGCDLSFPANKLVSGEHCKIVQDESSGLVWLEDMSTNGTVINMSKLVKKQSHMLQSGDVIYFVYRKNEPEQSKLLIYLMDFFHFYLTSTFMLTGAPRDPTQEEPQPSTSTSQISGPVAATASAASGRFSVNLKKKCTYLERERKMGTEKKWKTGAKIRRISIKTSAKTCVFCLSQLELTEVVGPARGGLGELLPKAPVEGTKTDKMEESLTCIICQDLLHDCVSLQPCMHTFCAACYSGWMERSSLCPTCRCPVERIRKNHILNNLVEAYLIQHPEKCRSEEDLKSMDSRNKITQDMLQPKIERSFSDEEGSSDYLFELSDNDSDASDISQPMVMCRQCPGYRKDVSQVLLATGCGKPGDLSSLVSPPTAPQEYHCPPQGCHVICTCCLQPMPDRRAELNSQQVAAQQCVLCQRPFCHMYWGCQRIGCQGCLARFSELNLTDKCLDGVLNNNNYESEILQNYLSSRGKSWRDVLQEGLQGLQQGTYYLSDCRITANTILCFCCGLRAFKELAYKYRQNIPPSELPAAVMSRPDCYWGRNCRTQVKAHHAMKFNHICEQTRFKS
uniref:E3 ubiquitin-protein ligase CHFR n=1 Tax=Myripristis murdjan TaxID=586833 RepID=A0A667ZDY9_9TELE